MLTINKIKRDLRKIIVFNFHQKCISFSPALLCKAIAVLIYRGKL